MGNDGGDIPRRKQLVKEKKKEEFANAQSIAMGRARFCNLTNEKLKQPLAICRLGCIYNYENILAARVQKSLPTKYQYIKKLSDIAKIQIQRAPSTSNNYITCPITKLQFNGFHKFIALWSCGHVMARKAFKEVKIEQNNTENDDKHEKHENQQNVLKKQSISKCIICNKEYTKEDVIDLNLDAQQMERRRKILLEQKNAKKNVQKPTIPESEPTKKVKKDFHLNSLDRLGSQFRDVIRERSKFKQLFAKIP